MRVCWTLLLGIAFGRVDFFGLVLFACSALLSVCLGRWPFLELLVVYQRCPCAGRHLLFFAGCKEKQPYWKSSGEQIFKVEIVGGREHFARVSRPRDLHD